MDGGDRDFIFSCLTQLEWRVSKTHRQWFARVNRDQRWTFYGDTFVLADLVNL